MTAHLLDDPRPTVLDALTFASARDQAKATVKELFDVAGLVTSSGNPAYADNRASLDSLAVAALREAGAVIIGKTNR
jgi:Asp-tRNA(Asn)/Glu-tRNA(Gln) amidotransferase A subunit family amidase